jgi:hypothetical protein
MKILKLSLMGIGFSLFLFSCKARWDEYDKAELLKRCIEMDAPRFGFSEPEKHCDCIVKKIVEKYPDPNQFENMEFGEYGAMVAECQGIDISTKVIWPESTKKAFVDSCTSVAKKQNKPAPDRYCQCVLTGIMNKYPTNDSLEKMSPQVLKEISDACDK